jgi:hypothetical protein
LFGEALLLREHGFGASAACACSGELATDSGGVRGHQGGKELTFFNDGAFFDENLPDPSVEEGANLRFTVRGRDDDAGDDQFVDQVSFLGFGV